MCATGGKKYNDTMLGIRATALQLNNTGSISEGTVVNVRLCFRDKLFGCNCNTIVIYTTSYRHGRSTMPRINWSKGCMFPILV